jgi:hypothetical protein
MIEGSKLNYKDNGDGARYKVQGTRCKEHGARHKRQQAMGKRQHSNTGNGSSFMQYTLFSSPADK